MTPVKWNDLSALQQQLLYAMQTKLQLQLNGGIPVRTMYLKPELFVIYEDIVKMQFNGDELAAAKNAGVGHMFMKVHIEKGTPLQFEPFTLDFWATTRKEQRKQREELKMNEVN